MLLLLRVQIGSISFQQTHLAQINQFLVSVDVEPRTTPLSSAAAKVLEVFKLSLEANCRKAYAYQDARRSSFKRSIASTLRDLEIRHQESIVDKNSGYCVDILCTDHGTCIAIQGDGPSQYLGAGRRASGAARLKNRHLVLMGYKVVSVPYWEWNALNGREEKEEYMLGRLAQVKMQSAAQIAHSRLHSDYAATSSREAEHAVANDNGEDIHSLPHTDMSHRGNGVSDGRELSHTTLGDGRSVSIDACHSSYAESTRGQCAHSSRDKTVQSVGSVPSQSINSVSLRLNGTKVANLYGSLLHESTTPQACRALSDDVVHLERTRLKDLAHAHESRKVGSYVIVRTKYNRNYSGTVVDVDEHSTRMLVARGCIDTGTQLHGASRGRRKTAQWYDLKDYDSAHLMYMQRELRQHEKKALEDSK